MHNIHIHIYLFPKLYFTFFSFLQRTNEINLTGKKKVLFNSPCLNSLSLMEQEPLSYSTETQFQISKLLADTFFTL